MLPLLAAFAGPLTAEPAEKVKAFLGKYCTECHGADVQKGDRSFSTFSLPLEKEAALIDAKDIIDQLTLREMPPKKAAQPNDEERLAMVRDLREAVTASRGKMQSAGARTVLRRLSSREYESTLAVLFGGRVDTLGLTAGFPKERTSGHMDTIGRSLVTSGFLVDQYFQAANRLVTARLDQPATEPQTWDFKGHFVQYEELQGPHRSAFDYRYLNLYEQPNTDTRQGGYGHIEDFLKGVPVSGWYDLEVEAQAMHRDTHYDPKIFGIDFSEPWQLAIVPGDVRSGHIHYPQAIEPVLAATTVPDDQPVWQKFRIWLEAGQTPRFIWPNGPYESRASVIQVNERYKDDFKGRTAGSDVSRTILLKEGKLPHIRISGIKVHGPVTPEGGHAAERAVFGDGGFDAARGVEQVLAFAEKAWRRPLTDADRAPLRSFYDKRIAEQAAPRAAALDAIKLILCSPAFLYLSEITPESEKRLAPHDLAPRLSYALWAAPPDEPLLAAARSGALITDDGLRREIARMVADERITGFVHGFTDSWLRLRDLGSMPPPREDFRAYYSGDLPASMRTEARMFFRDLLNADASIAGFLDARHTFVDKRLAKLYGLPEQKTLRLADGFRRVDLPADGRRGGLLGMAAVHTVSANGVETSPVTRGVWVSENILGIHPPPPPDEVPAIDPDVSGATTIRDRLAKHRADPACAECHRKIDPLGFPLESFDPIGHWRDEYPAQRKKGKAGPIDTSGEFPSGESFTDIATFKKILLETRRDLFTRHLIRQVLTYTTGRHMESADDFLIDDLQTQVRQQGGGLRSLITACLMSDIFRSR